MVSLKPPFSATCEFSLRNASSSVMSASSCWVTCGIETQLRCRNPPESFLIRDRGLVSTGPNFAKSTCGHSGRSRTSAPRATTAATAGAPLITPFTNSWTSACVMRPFGPEPLTRARSTPSSRANLRTEGLACGGVPGAGADVLEMASVRPRAGAAGVGAGTAASTGAAFAEGASWGFGAGFVGAAEAFSVSSRMRMGLPCETLSPVLTRNSFTTPAAGEGISIVALSDSTAISDCSGCTASPGLTSTSITSTFLKSPMSGTKTSLWVPMLAQSAIGVPGRAAAEARQAHARSDSHWIGLFRIDPVFLDCFGNDFGFDFALIGERPERRDCHEVTIHFEEVTQLGARIRAAVPIGAEHSVDAAFGDKRSNLVGKGLHVVGSSDHGTFALLKALGHVRDLGLRFRMQHVPTLDREPFAAQLREAGRAPDIRSHAPVGLEQLAGGNDFAQDRSRAQQLHARLFLRAFPKEVHALQDRLLRTRRHRGMLVVFVHHRDVIEHVLLLRDHPTQAILNDDGEFIGKGRIIRNAIGNDRREHMAVPVLMLQSLAIQSRAARRGAEEKPPRALVPGRPRKVPDALHAEHRIEDVERHHDKVRMAV